MFGDVPPYSFDVIEGPRISEITIGGEPMELFDDTVIGFNQAGREIVRVKVEDPVAERPNKLNSI